ncbi:MAG: hypothetical protein H0V17_00415 [Deltaproteobacteria bacterium]|nr:hypothetical protein [Deltaproteobacteria bacterium]
MVNRLAIAVLVAGACVYEAPSSNESPAVPPVISFEYANSGGDEGLDEAGTTLKVPVILNKPSDQRITVQCTAIAGGTAEEQRDFVVATHDITFEPGVTRVDVTVDIIHDLVEGETAETFALALSDASGATLDENNIIHEVVIADHILPRIAFATAATTTGEATPTQLVLSLTAPSEGISTVVIGVNFGLTTPMDTEDIALDEGTVVTIPAGVMSMSVPIGENPDSLHENPTENATFELKGASQNLVIDSAKKLATHAITDDDAAPIVDFAVVSSNAAEGVGTATIEVRSSAESGLPVTVAYNRQNGDTAANADATILGSTVTFAARTPGVPGSTSQLITVEITNDATDEDPETVIVDLDAAPANATRGTNITHTLTIDADTNDPPSIVSFDAMSSSLVEANSTRQIQINIVPPSGKTISVPFSIAPQSSAEEAGNGAGNDDYDLNTTTPFSIPPDTGTFTFRIDINNDTDPEGTETILIDLGTPTNATRGANDRHTITITDGD